MALFQCVIATFVAAGAAVQPEAPVRRHRDALPQAAADCTTDKKFSGASTWKGRCYTLDKCRNECKAAAGCEAFNWWPAKGGCRHHGAGYTEGGATPWATIGGKSDCILDVTGPTDCATCPSCTTAAPTPAPAPVNVPATTWCGKGITNPLSKSNICCAASCLNEAGTPECGGSGCGSREGGKNKCCHNFITRECENFDDVACVKPTAAYHSLENSNNQCDKDHESRHIGHIKTIQCDDNGGRTIPQCAEECKNTPTCKGFGYGNAGGEHCSGDKGKCHMFSVKYCDTNPTWKWHALGQASLDFTNHTAVIAAAADGKISILSSSTSDQITCNPGETKFVCGTGNGHSTDGYNYCGDDSACFFWQDAYPNAHGRTGCCYCSACVQA